MFFLRQVNCLTTPERQIVEAFRVLVFGSILNPMPLTVYEGLWSLATWGVEARRTEFEQAFSIITFYVDDVGFVTSTNPGWFVAYNTAVEVGEAPILDQCPCSSF